ncbi:MAG: hypothetical protein CMP81_18805 [Fulvimarina sp.]|nr:hypothetical protein [Fulvimarina sp.]
MGPHAAVESWGSFDLKSRHWIVPSIAAVLGGIGYGVAQNMPSGDASVSAAPAMAEAGEGVAAGPTTGDRVSLGYRRNGDQDFAEVKVATVEPFRDAITVDAHIAAAVAADAAAPAAERIAGETALAPVYSSSRSRTGAAAFLTKVAAAGDAAASASSAMAEGSVEAAPAFETTPLSKRLFDAEQPEWQSRFFADNPLVGGIFQGDGNPADAAALIGAARSARYVLLGEKHDNPDHHRLQSDIVADLAQNAANLSLVFEMIPQRLGSAVSAFGTERGTSIDLEGLADRLEWAERGWPDFSMYRPLFETAKQHGFPVAPGNLDREVVSSIVANGVSSLSPEERARLSLDTDADPAMLADLMNEVRSSHCGLMPEGSIAPMADAQRARDGALAAAMQDAAKDGDTAVLIAGFGHVRNDRGVPAILKRRDADAGTVSVRMLEVDGEDGAVADYGLTAEAPAPYDFTIFTPRVDIDDPCEALRAQMPAKDAPAAD